MSTEKWQTVLCFWCREPRGDRSIAEPGDDRLEVIRDYRPCFHCMGLRSEGIFIAEVASEPGSPGQPSLQEGTPNANVTDAGTEVQSPPVYPTGNWLIFDPDGLRSVFPDEIADIAEAQHQLLFHEELYRLYFPPQLFQEVEAERLADETGGVN